MLQNRSDCFFQDNLDWRLASQSFPLHFEFFLARIIIASHISKIPKYYSFIARKSDFCSEKVFCVLSVYLNHIKDFTSIRCLISHTENGA